MKNFSRKLGLSGAEFALPICCSLGTLNPNGRDIKKIISHIIKNTKIKDTMLIQELLYFINMDVYYGSFRKRIFEFSFN